MQDPRYIGVRQLGLRGVEGADVIGSIEACRHDREDTCKPLDGQAVRAYRSRMLDDITTAALTAALDLCNAVQASAQSERALLEHADRCRRACTMAMRKHAGDVDVWEIPHD